jgi:hypothetical protein
MLCNEWGLILLLIHSFVRSFLHKNNNQKPQKACCCLSSLSSVLTIFFIQHECTHHRITADSTHHPQKMNFISQENTQENTAIEIEGKVDAPSLVWWLCSTTGEPANGNRLHTRIEGRFITIFRHHGKLSAIDSICHHAGGPLTQGGVQDIEDLGVSVVSCPW